MFRTVALRAVGVGSGDVANARDAVYAADVLERRYKVPMDNFRTRGKNYMTKAVIALERGDEEERRKYEDKYRKLLEQVGDFLSDKEIMYNMKSFNSAVLDAVDQRLQGGVRYKDLDKNSKRYWEIMNKTFMQEE